MKANNSIPPIKAKPAAATNPIVIREGAVAVSSPIQPASPSVESRGAQQSLAAEKSEKKAGFNNGSAVLSSYSLRCLGNKAFNNKQFSDAIKYYKDSLNNALKTNTASNIIYALNNLILTQISLDPKNKALFGFYKLLYTKLNGLKQNSSKLYKKHRNKSINRLMQAAEHIPHEKLLTFSKGKIDSHTIETLTTLHHRLKKVKLSVMTYKEGLGIKLHKSSKTITPTGATSCVLALYTGKLCRNARLHNGLYFPNARQHLYLSPYHPTQQAYTVGTGIPLSLEWAADLCNDGTLQGMTLDSYKQFCSVPCDETLIAFHQSYEENRQLYNNCHLSFIMLNPEIGFTLEAAKPIHPNEQLLAPYGSGYWVTKISYQYRARGELTTHQKINLLAHKHNIFEGQAQQQVPFVNLSLITQAIDPNSTDFELTNRLFDSYNEPSGYNDQTKGAYVLSTLLMCAISVVSCITPVFCQLDNWEQIVAHENTRLPILISNFSTIIQKSISSHLENSSPEQVERLNLKKKEWILKISVYALLVLELGKAQTFPAPLLLRLMNKGLFSLTLVDNCNQPIQADGYRLTL